LRRFFVFIIWKKSRHLSLSAYSWQYSATTNDLISANPILEMRTALDQALGAPSPAYATGLAQGQPVKKVHIQELRDRVLAAWISGTGGTDIQWLVADQLGTPRMIFDKTGSLANTKRHDYLPFGEELFVGTGGRTTAQGYTADTVRQKFTSKERDNETGLDYFGARYYASTQGRFSSPDPFSIILLRQNSPKDEKTRAALNQFINDPRRWNRFAYAVNSPLVFTDKTGLDIMVIENHATEGNPAGHTAIAVTGRGVWSSGNADPQGDIVRGGVKDYIVRELPRRDTTITIIKTTKAQDDAAAATLDTMAGSGQPLTAGSILVDNCSVRANKALDAAGVEPGPLDPAIPGSAGLRAVSDPATRVLAEKIEISQNSNLTKGDLDVIRQFEPTMPQPRVPKPGEPGGTSMQTMPMRRQHD
jgi:RHS repeat-associated protein